MQVARIWGCGVGGRDLSEPSMLHGGKGQKFPTGNISRGPEMTPVFNSFPLFHSWFGLSWAELNLHQLPEPGLGGSPLTQGSLAWGATGTELLLCPPDHLSGQHADLGLFSQENKALVTLGWSQRGGPLARSAVLAGPVPQARFGEQGWGQAWSLDPGSQPGEVNGSPRSAGGKGWRGEWSGCAASGVSLWGQRGTATPVHPGSALPLTLALAGGGASLLCQLRTPQIPCEPKEGTGMVLLFGSWAWSGMCCCSQPCWCMELLGLGVPRCSLLWAQP